MSSIYKNLTEEDLKVEKESLKNLEKQLESKSGGIAGGFKTVIIGGFILSLASVIGSGYLYKVIHKEQRQREAIEAAQVQMRERANAMEEDTSKSKTEIVKLRQQLQTYTAQRAEFEKKLEDSRKEVAQLRTKLKEIEEKSEAINKAAEKIQTELDLQPVGPALPGTAAVASAGQAKTAVKAAAPAPLNKTFQVLTINRKFNFVVINVGLKDNLKIGDVLQTQRNEKTTGQVTIEKIYDNFAAATISKETKELPIKEGDRISKV